MRKTQRGIWTGMAWSAKTILRIVFSTPLNHLLSAHVMNISQLYPTPYIFKSTIICKISLSFMFKHNHFFIAFRANCINVILSGFFIAIFIKNDFSSILIVHKPMFTKRAHNFSKCIFRFISPDLNDSLNTPHILSIRYEYVAVYPTFA